MHELRRLGDVRACSSCGRSSACRSATRCWSAAIVYLFMTGQDIGLVASQSLNGLYGSFVLMAVPLFILSAEIMNAARMTDKLFGFANVLVGPLKGGLAHVNIVVEHHLLRHERQRARRCGGAGQARSRHDGEGRLLAGLLRRAVDHVGHHRADHPAIDSDGALRRRLRTPRSATFSWAA